LLKTTAVLIFLEGMAALFFLFFGSKTPFSFAFLHKKSSKSSSSCHFEAGGITQIEQQTYATNVISPSGRNDK
jgi:hypothetical protein